MEEPSVLDYLKSLLNPWKKEKILIPENDPSSEPEPDLSPPDRMDLEAAEPVETHNGQKKDEDQEIKKKFPWGIFIAIVFALISQRMLEPPDRNLGLAVSGYVIAIAAMIFSIIRSPMEISSPKDSRFGQIHLKGTPLIISLVFALASFIGFGNHQFSSVNLLLWLSSLIFGVYAFWQTPKGQPTLISSIRNLIRKPEWRLRITPWSVLMILSISLVFFFRFFRLGEVPGEMFSDHAEKLLDVADVLNGNRWTYFPRNTGREAIQMYLTAAVALIFKTGLSFMSLKIGTALAGFLTLPFIFLLGKELGNRWTGLFAFLFAGVAYWPNVIARIGLRFPLYPLFVAPVLYFLVRGLRRGKWNNFLLAGLALGIGLHGYSPVRFLPFVITAVVGLYLIHPLSHGNRKQAIFGLLALAFIAFLVFIPLFRYWIDDPLLFSYRMMTRMGTVEREFSAPVLSIFFSNFWKSITMFFWDNGNIWVHSVTGRPALSVAAGSLFLLSVVFLIIRYIRKQNWQDLFLIVSVPLLMMPSILSLAFPDENPSLNRSGGAVIPVFIMIAIWLQNAVSMMLKNSRWIGKALVILLVILLLLVSVNQDFDLVFRQFDQQFIAGAWNTSEIGGVIRGYVDSTIGSRDSAYVVPFPYWVDTRLVGINAGFPEKDYALWPEQFAEITEQPGAKLFILKAEDQDSLISLQQIFPQASAWLYPSKIAGKEFWVMLAPPEPTSDLLLQPEDSGE